MLDLELTASLPAEMVQAQQDLISWMEKKISVCHNEAIDLQGAYEHAKKQAWKSSTLKRHADLAMKRVKYYEKIKLALQEGYYIIPNFPIEIFAIRTDRKNPLKMLSTIRWARHMQHAAEVQTGEGEYKNPRPVVFENHHEVHKPGTNETQTITKRWAEDWQDIEFPVTMAKPQIMELTSRAMALKVFDQIGILPATKNDDPVIIGQIINKKGYQTKIVSFMIAWHLNTNTL